MKRNMLKIVGGTITTLTLVAALAFGPAFGQDEAKSTRGGGRLAGTWDVRVSIRNCQTGAEIRGFNSIGTFMSGGTMLDTTTGMPPTMRTPGHGVWSHTDGRNYRFSFKAFSFDAAGNATGWQIVRHEATLEPNGDEYTSAGTAEFYAPNGTLVSTGCSSTTAVRFQ